MISPTILKLVIPFLLHLLATDERLLFMVLSWTYLLQPWLQCRIPNRLILLSLLDQPHRQACSTPPRLPHRQASLPFAYPAMYLLSSYMLELSFVCFLLSLVNRISMTLISNPWMEPDPPPPAPGPDPHDFLPEWMRGHGPPKRLALLGLLAAIAISNTMSSLCLASGRTLKNDLWKYRGASGFVTKTSNIQPHALS
jgi:hypothetical protein